MLSLPRLRLCLPWLPILNISLSATPKFAKMASPPMSAFTSPSSPSPAPSPKALPPPNANPSSIQNIRSMRTAEEIYVHLASWMTTIQFLVHFHYLNRLNEEMIETLFVVNAPNNTNPNQSNLRPLQPSENMFLDQKKAQNIAISLRALNVTVQEVCEALLEGNAETLGTELLESLLKMAPTKEEEWKLKEYKDDSPC